MRALHIGAAGKWVRRLSTALLWALGIVIVGAVISLLGIRLLGGVQGFEGWLRDHRFHLLAWRLLLYGATVIGWYWMRKRLLLREPHNTTRARLRRCEFSALAVIFALEMATWLKSS